MSSCMMHVWKCISLIGKVMSTDFLSMDLIPYLFSFEYLSTTPHLDESINLSPKSEDLHPH